MAFISIIDVLNEFRGNMLSVFDTEALIRYGGLLIIFLAVYAQTGLFFCFFLPSGVYLFGRKTGPLLYTRKDSRFFRQKHLRAAEYFYNKYGQFALTVGLLFPITRTFAPIVAGIIRMKFMRFFLLVFIGSVLWIPIFILAGYLIGSVPALKEYLTYIVTTFILIVTTPLVIRIITEFKKQGRKVMEEVEEDDTLER